MEWAPEASGGGPAETQPPREPAGSQGPAEARPPGRPGSPPGPAAAGREDHPEGQRLPSPRPGAPPPSLGYGAFRRLGSAGRAPPEPPADGAPPGSEPAAGPWAPVELQVDVRVKPAGPAPSPPSARFLTLPVPESPAAPRRAGPAPPPSPAGSSWGRSSPLAAAPAGPGAEREDAGLLRRAGLDGRRLPRAIALIGLPVYMKSLRWALAVMAVFLAVCTVTIVALAARVGVKSRPCPQDWLWFEGHCYYLSPEAEAWEAGQAFCSAHHATLPLLLHTQGLLSRYPVTRSSWVGARRGPRGWHWTDGTPLPPQLLPEEGKDDPDLSCGSLEDGRLVALDCGSRKPWVCAKGTQ